MSNETWRSAAGEVGDPMVLIAQLKAELESLKVQALERRRDRVLEVALRLMAVDEDSRTFRDYVPDAIELIAEVERQVTP